MIIRTSEKFDWQKLAFPLVGVDEVGRGCLAGPVFAGAVHVSDREWQKRRWTRGLVDSKQITAKKRSMLAEKIHESFCCSVAESSVAEIDRINILQASLLAMARALASLENKGLEFQTVCVDGNRIIPEALLRFAGLRQRNFTQIAIIEGDSRCPVISAAAIAAKVSRDALMIRFGEEFPGYGFESHKGYGSPAHLEALRAKGPLAIHRRHFAGVRELTEMDGEFQQGVFAWE